LVFGLKVVFPCEGVAGEDGGDSEGGGREASERDAV
jgi:hypothetical protein